MADAKKCDRCKEYYDDYRGVGFSEGQAGYDKMFLVPANDYNRNKRYDLCPTCMAALISFIKQGEKQC